MTSIRPARTTVRHTYLRSKDVIELSVVIPVYGCRPCLVALNERLVGELSELGVAYEIVYVDDRSPDGAWEILAELASSHADVRAVRLSRNFGQHAAITAGMGRAHGRWVVVMDCDLQDPPEGIPVLYAKAKEGFDIVFARRTSRQHSWVRRLGARGYFWMLSVFFGARLDGEYGTFSIVSRRVADAVPRAQGCRSALLFILNWLGFESTAIDVEHHARYEGRSSYTFSKLVAHGFDGLVFQTTRLLRWIVYAGFLIAFLGVVLAGFFVYSWAVHTGNPGWTSLAVLLLLLSGFIILSLGVTGLYVGKIFGQVKERPLYVIDEELGVSKLERERVREDAVRSTSTVSAPLSKSVAIVQSNYIPWKGYFDIINSVDEFILYDDRQYTRRDWRNRNRIKTERGTVWLSIPVRAKGKYFQRIDATEVSDLAWGERHWRTLTHTYGRAPYFDTYRKPLQALYGAHDETHLSKINRRYIEAICEILEISTALCVVYRLRRTRRSNRAPCESLSGGGRDNLPLRPGGPRVSGRVALRVCGHRASVHGLLRLPRVRTALSAVRARRVDPRSPRAHRAVRRQLPQVFL